MTRRQRVLPVPRRRGALALLLDPVFGGVFWGKLISAGAVWIHAVVAAIVIFEATQSAFAVGLVTAAQFTPQLLLAPWSGTLADRGHVWAQMLIGRLLCVTGSAFVALWTFVREDVSGWAGAWPLVVASLIVGLGFVVGGPAQQSVIPRLVTDEELPTAMTLNTAPMTFARIAGPVIGAYVASHLGAWQAFAIAAGGHLVFVLILLAITIPDDEPHEPGLDYSARAGIAYVRSRRPLLLVILGVGAAGIGGEPALTLAPSLAHELGGGAQMVGNFGAAFGVGSGVGLLCATVLGRRTSVEVVATAGLACMALGSLLASMAWWTPVAIAAFAVAGLGFTFSTASLGTLAQQKSPAYLRGRVMALWNVGFLGSRPVAGFLLGGITDLANVYVAIAILAVFLGAMTVLCRPGRLRN